MDNHAAPRELACCCVIAHRSARQVLRRMLEGQQARRAVPRATPLAWRTCPRMAQLPRWPGSHRRASSPLLSLLCRPDPAGADRSSLGPPRRRLATEAKAPTPSFGRGRAGVRLPPAVPGMGRVPALGLVFRSVPVTQRECGSFRSWCQSGPSAIFHDCIRGSTYTNTPATLSSVVQTTDSYEHNGRPVSAKATAA